MLKQGLGFGAQGREFFVGVDGDEQLSAVGEVPVQGGAGDAGTASDLVQGRVRPTLAEDLLGRDQ
jgi:hypothetical protein